MPVADPVLSIFKLFDPLAAASVEELEVETVQPPTVETQPAGILVLASKFSDAIIVWPFNFIVTDNNASAVKKNAQRIIGNRINGAGD